MKASEAREKSSKIKFGAVDPEAQLQDVLRRIDLAIKEGALYMTYPTEICPNTQVELKELGYSIMSGGVNGISVLCDVVYW